MTYQHFEVWAVAAVVALALHAVVAFVRAASKDHKEFCK